MAVIARIWDGKAWQIVDAGTVPPIDPANLVLAYAEGTAPATPTIQRAVNSSLPARAFLDVTYQTVSLGVIGSSHQVAFQLSSGGECILRGVDQWNEYSVLNRQYADERYEQKITVLDGGSA